MPKFVDVETPYAGETEIQLMRNLLYARACIRDCLVQGEVPFASHLFYTQPGILDDNIPTDREIGINVGKELIESLSGIVTVVYQDLGISRGMQYGIDRALTKKRTVEYRLLGKDWIVKELSTARSHSHAKIWGFELSLTPDDFKKV